MKISLILAMFACLYLNPSYSKNKGGPPATELKKIEKFLLSKFKRNYKSKKEIGLLKKRVFNLSGRAVPALIKIMKSEKFPDKNRWVATFLLGKIMGKKSAPFISTFLNNKNWVMRMASLKTLLALGQRKMGGLYVKALKDKSLLVRSQALDNIRSMNLSHLAPHVWAMLYDKRNYYDSKPKKDKEVRKKGKERDGARKRTHIIKKVIKTIGDLRFSKAMDPLLKMIQKDKYKDIFDEMDYTLAKLSGRNSPSGKRSVKKYFWSRYSISKKTL